MQITVVGAGYVGLVTGAVLADLGSQVVCVDKDPAKIALLRQGRSPIFEPGLEELIVRGMAAGRLRFTTEIREAASSSSIVFIAVGTPQAEDGSPDLSAVMAAAREIGRSAMSGLIVVNKSTVPVGSGEMVERIMTEEGADPATFDVVSNPEFLREGSAISDTLHPDRIVIGAKNRAAAERLAKLYEPLGAPVLITSLESAELIKYGSNSFLAAKISFINAMSRICELAGADIEDVAKGIGMDRRIGPQHLMPGLGWGGSCFPKDVRGLLRVSQGLGYDFAMLTEVEEINRTQTLHFLGRLRDRLGGLKGRRVALLGLAFKPNTDDIRDAKSLVILEDLLREGAEASAYDPAAMSKARESVQGVRWAGSALEAVADADAVMLVTEWNEFRQLDLREMASVMREAVLFDGRRVFRREDAEAAGFEYFAVGSPSRSGARGA